MLPCVPRELGTTGQEMLLRLYEKEIPAKGKLFLSPTLHLYSIDFIRDIAVELAENGDTQVIDVKKWLSKTEKIPQGDIEYFLDLLKQHIPWLSLSDTLYATKRGIIKMKTQIGKTIWEKKVARYNEIFPQEIDTDILPEKEKLPQEILELREQEIVSSDDHDIFYSYAYIEEYLSTLAKKHTRYSIECISKDLKISVRRLRQILLDVILKGFLVATISDNEILFSTQ